MIRIRSCKQLLISHRNLFKAAAFDIILLSEGLDEWNVIQS